MAKTIVGFVLASLVMIFTANSANAQTQISLGGDSQTATFTGGGSTLSANFGSGGTGVGDFQQGLTTTSGTYTLTQGGVGPITMTSTNGGASFDVQMNTANLTFSWTSGTNSLSGNIVLTSAADDTASPRFVGTLQVTGVSSGLYSTLWSVGDDVNIDFTVTLGGNPTLETIFKGTTTASTTGSYSSGEVLPSPEPMSLALLGSGLIMVGGVLRRRFRE